MWFGGETDPAKAGSVSLEVGVMERYKNGDRSGICFGGCVACDARELPNVHRGIEPNDLEQGIIRGNSGEQQPTSLRREALLPPKKVRHSPRFWGCQSIRPYSPPASPHARPHRFQADERIRKNS